MLRSEPTEPRIIPDIVRQHVEDAILMYRIRTAMTRAAQVSLPDLRRFDDRLEAHLSGLAIAAGAGWPFCTETLQSPTVGSVFIVAVRSIVDRQLPLIDRLFALAQSVPETTSALVSAFGWLEHEHLRGTVARLLASESAFEREIGVGICAVHRVDPGIESGTWIRDRNGVVRSRAVRAAGQLGLLGLLETCASRARTDEGSAQFWAATSAVLLGDRQSALDVLTGVGLTAGPHRRRAFWVACQAMSTAAAHETLKRLAADPAQARWVIEGSGIVGDPTYIPWLVKHMTDDKLARISGEAFTLITGADLALLDLERKPPENFESGPNDDPEDPNVEMDPDDGLPWPDQARVQAWWDANGQRFQKGLRYFVGAPVTREHCIDVLKNGYQRQRILAAHHLCLLEPGTPLFNTSAPAWRQQKLLAQM